MRSVPRCDVILSRSSSILLEMDQMFARNMLGSGTLCGVAFSLACSPTVFLCFCFRSLRYQRCHPADMLTEAASGGVSQSIFLVIFLILIFKINKAKEEILRVSLMNLWERDAVLSPAPLSDNLL